MPITYKRMVSETDPDIPKLISVFRLPEVVRYYEIDFENYFSYVTSNPFVYFYKAYESDEMIGAFHLEKSLENLFLSIVIFPEFQGKGKGSKIIEDIKNDIFGLDYRKIEVGINDDNIASLRLFEKQGFVPVSKDSSIINYVYEKQ